MSERRGALYPISAVLLALATGFFSPAPAGAQTYPARRITIVVPYTAGSGFDTVARTVGQKISERWGQPVVVDNKPGASGNIGAEAVAHAAPDGYTFLMTGAPHTVSASLNKNLRFDPVGGFTPLGTVATSGLALVFNPAVFPVNSLEEFLAQVRAKPGQLNHSSPGTGTLQHLGMELFKQQLGLNVVHVPYRGAATALTDLLTGQVQFTFLPVHSARPHVQDGKLRMLAVASAKRSAFAPDVPTLTELGYPSVDFELWYGFFGPANLPPAIVERWEKELAAIATMPDVKEGLERQGMAPVFWDAATTGARVKAEAVRWREVVEKAGIKAE
jgi:tripartite-type tricarboxylate transporter receptor subunit TctC